MEIKLVGSIALTKDQPKLQQKAGHGLIFGPEKTEVLATLLHFIGNSPQDKKTLRLIERLLYFFNYSNLHNFREEPHALLITRAKELVLFIQNADLIPTQTLNKVAAQNALITAAAFDNYGISHEYQHIQSPFLRLDDLSAKDIALLPEFKTFKTQSEKAYQDFGILKNALSHYDFCENPALSAFIIELNLQLLESMLGINQQCLDLRKTLAFHKNDEGIFIHEAAHAVELTLEWLLSIQNWKSGIGSPDPDGRCALSSLEAMLRSRRLPFEDEGQVIRNASRLTIPAFDLELIFLNLRSNAYDAKKKGIPLELKVFLSLDKQLPATQLKIVFTDNGVGMSESVLKKVREILSSGNPDHKKFTTKGSHGSGRGLPILHEIIKKAGGSIEVNSSIEKGSVFTVLLPLIPL